MKMTRTLAVFHGLGQRRQLSAQGAAVMVQADLLVLFDRCR